MSVARHSIFHSVAHQFIVAMNGDVHADNFMPWLKRPEQHTLMHAFLSCMSPETMEERFDEYIEVLAKEYEAWRDGFAG